MLALGVTIGLASLVDVLISWKQAKRFGSEIELNPLVSWLMPRLGNLLGSAVGILTPTAAIVALLWHAPLVLAIYTGIKLHTTLQQISFLAKLNLLTKLAGAESLPILPSSAPATSVGGSIA